MKDTDRTKEQLISELGEIRQRAAEPAEKPVKIEQVSEREILVGENRFYLGEDNILYETIAGGPDERTVTEMEKAVEQLLNVVDGKVDLLVDLNRAGRPSSRARKMGQEIFEDKRWGKIALFGLHPVARVIASFVIGGTRKKDIRFFKTEEEALQWLKD